MDEHLNIVIVTYNSAPMIMGLLDSIPDALGNLTADVVVVDNGSHDGTADAVAKRSDCVLVRSSNGGYSAGINKGVAHVRGVGPILILNPDVRLAPGAVEFLVSELRHPAVGVVAPRVLDGVGVTSWSLRREPTLLRAAGLGFTRLPMLDEYVTGAANYDLPRDVDWALGAALMVSRRCYDELGGWDESYFLYSEETDFCLRARDNGWLTRYVPAARVTHIGGQSGRSSRTHVMQIINKIRLYARRHADWASWAYFLLTFLGEVKRFVGGHREGLSAMQALLVPARRPPELGLGPNWLPQ